MNDLSTMRRENDAGLNPSWSLENQVSYVSARVYSLLPDQRREYLAALRASQSSVYWYADAPKCFDCNLPKPFHAFYCATFANENRRGY
jgi:hypothetical protein